MKIPYLSLAAKSGSKLSIPSFSAGINLSRDESTLSIAEAKNCYNFRFSKGELTDGLGVEQYAYFPNISVVAMYAFSRYDSGWQHYIVCYAADNKMYYRLGGGEVTRLGDLILSAPPQCISYRLNGEDVLFICSADDGMFVWNGSGDAYAVTSAPPVTSLALHGERLFVTVNGEKNAVWFSDDLDPTNWDTSLSGGGFIQLIDERGSLNRVISYLGYVYVFRDYGISRISALGRQTDFSVSNLFVSGGKIIPSTVCLCGDVVMFLASDGLYAFDGVSVRKLLPKLSELFADKTNATALYAHGRYYVSFRYDENGEKVGCENGEYVNNVLFCLDIASGEYEITRGVDIVGFYADQDDVAVITSDGATGRLAYNGSYYGTPLDKKWCVPKTSLGSEVRKKLSELFIYTATPLTVRLYTDQGEQIVNVNGGEGSSRARLNLLGSRVGVDISTAHVNCRIAQPTVRFSKKQT